MPNRINLGAVAKLGAAVAVLVAAAGTIVFLREGPEVVESNASAIEAVSEHVAFHHDSLASLTEIAAAIERHLEAEEEADHVRDSIMRAQARRTEYLVCLREQRARELDGLAVTRDCGLEAIR